MSRGVGDYKIKTIRSTTAGRHEKEQKRAEGITKLIRFPRFRYENLIGNFWMVVYRDAETTEGFPEESGWIWYFTRRAREGNSTRGRSTSDEKETGRVGTVLWASGNPTKWKQVNGYWENGWKNVQISFIFTCLFLQNISTKACNSDGSNQHVDGGKGKTGSILYDRIQPSKSSSQAFFKHFGWWGAPEFQLRPQHSPLPGRTSPGFGWREGECCPGKRDMCGDKRSRWKWGSAILGTHANANIPALKCTLHNQHGGGQSHSTNSTTKVQRCRDTKGKWGTPNRDPNHGHSSWKKSSGEEARWTKTRASKVRRVPWETNQEVLTLPSSSQSYAPESSKFNFTGEIGPSRIQGPPGETAGN